MHPTTSCKSQPKFHNFLLNPLFRQYKCEIGNFVAVEEIENEIAAAFDAKTVNAMRQKIDFEITTVSKLMNLGNIAFFRMIYERSRSKGSSIYECFFF